MAIRKAKISKKISKMIVEEKPVVESKQVDDVAELSVKTLAFLIVVGVVVFWWKTNSWPVVAMVNKFPITRFEVDKQLYSQGGAQVLDQLITQRLVSEEMNKRKVVISDNDLSGKLTEIQKQLGSNMTVEQALSLQGMTVVQFKEQLKFQMALERLVEPTTDSAKLRQEMLDLIDTLKKNAKIWTIK